MFRLFWISAILEFTSLEPFCRILHSVPHKPMFVSGRFKASSHGGLF